MNRLTWAALIVLVLLAGSTAIAIAQDAPEETPPPPSMALADHATECPADTTESNPCTEGGVGVYAAQTNNSSDDLIYGTQGADVIRGYAGVDVIDGNLGDDTIYGGDNPDILSDRSSDDADRIYGGAGDDIIEVNDVLTTELVDGPNNNDYVDGGGGNNTCYVNPGDEWHNCQTLIIEELSFEEASEYSIPRRDNKIICAWHSPSISVVCSGGSGRNLMVGSLGNDSINAGSDHDTLIGRAGSDSLNGGAGNDVIVDRNGNDQDTVTGGGGGDTIDVRDRATDLSEESETSEATRSPEADTVDCGDGPDVVYADADDTVASNCETVIHDPAPPPESP